MYKNGDKPTEATTTTTEPHYMPPEIGGPVTQENIPALKGVAAGIAETVYQDTVQKALDQALNPLRNTAAQIQASVRAMLAMKPTPPPEGIHPVNPGAAKAVEEESMKMPPGAHPSKGETIPASEWLAASTMEVLTHLPADVELAKATLYPEEDFCINRVAYQAPLVQDIYDVDDHHDTNNADVNSLREYFVTPYATNQNAAWILRHYANVPPLKDVPFAQTAQYAGILRQLTDVGLPGTHLRGSSVNDANVFSAALVRLGSLDDVLNPQYSSPVLPLTRALILAKNTTLPYLEDAKCTQHTAGGILINGDVEFTGAHAMYYTTCSYQQAADFLGTASDAWITRTLGTVRRPNLEFFPWPEDQVLSDDLAKALTIVLMPNTVRASMNLTGRGGAANPGVVNYFASWDEHIADTPRILCFVTGQDPNGVNVMTANTDPAIIAPGGIVLPRWAIWRSLEILAVRATRREYLSAVFAATAMTTKLITQRAVVPVNGQYTSRSSTVERGWPRPAMYAPPVTNLCLRYGRYAIVKGEWYDGPTFFSHNTASAVAKHMYAVVEHVAFHWGVNPLHVMAAMRTTNTYSDGANPPYIESLHRAVSEWCEVSRTFLLGWVQDSFDPDVPLGAGFWVMPTELSPLDWHKQMGLDLERYIPPGAPLTYRARAPLLQPPHNGIQTGLAVTPKSAGSNTLEGILRIGWMNATGIGKRHHPQALAAPPLPRLEYTTFGWTHPITANRNWFVRPEFELSWRSANRELARSDPVTGGSNEHNRVGPRPLMVSITCVGSGDDQRFSGDRLFTWLERTDMRGPNTTTPTTTPFAAIHHVSADPWGDDHDVDFGEAVEALW